MSRFIESIQLKDGQLKHLGWHLDRMQRTVQTCYGQTILLDVTVIENAVENYPKGLYKCRIIYTHKIEEITFQAYQVSPIHSLQLVTSQLDYSLKKEDRTELNRLFQQREDCDDVLIVKNGCLTDGSYTNIALFDGDNWWTPSVPLLKGVQRSVLLSKGIIKERKITVASLSKYQKIKLFNAMMDWEVAPEVPLTRVKSFSKTHFEY